MRKRCTSPQIDCVAGECDFSLEALAHLIIALIFFGRLQNGDLSDQAVKDAAKNLAEMIGTEAETLNVGYSKDVP